MAGEIWTHNIQVMSLAFRILSCSSKVLLSSYLHHGWREAINRLQFLAEGLLEIVVVFLERFEPTTPMLWAWHPCHLLYCLLSSDSNGHWLWKVSNLPASFVYMHLWNVNERPSWDNIHCHKFDNDILSPLPEGKKSPFWWEVVMGYWSVNHLFCSLWRNTDKWIYIFVVTFDRGSK
jgi:hypothetical protein